jgi:D-inositol-3-phosphate glycosyltransferase
MSSLYDKLLLDTPQYRDQEEHSLAFIEEAFNDAINTIRKTKEVLQAPILEASNILVNCFQRNKKLLICGNGGSAAECQHLAGELVGRFEIAKRKGLPAIALTADSAVLTAWSNDFSYDDVFARQVEAYGQKGDVLLCFSTSGQSANVINALKMALEKEMVCIALSGKGGGDASLYAHVNIVVPSNSTQRVQELHLHILHTICSIVESKLFEKKGARKAVANSNGHARYVNGNGKSAVRLNGKVKTSS